MVHISPEEQVTVENLIISAFLRTMNHTACVFLATEWARFALLGY